jgi:hypothetical protein
MRQKALIMLLLLLITALSYAGTLTGPVIDFPELKHDFGTIGQDGRPEYFFGFSNKGDQELMIEKVSAT